MKNDDDDATKKPIKPYNSEKYFAIKKQTIGFSAKNAFYYLSRIILCARHGCLLGVCTLLVRSTMSINNLPFHLRSNQCSGATQHSDGSSASLSFSFFLATAVHLLKCFRSCLFDWANLSARLPTVPCNRTQKYGCKWRQCSEGRRQCRACIGQWGSEAVRQRTASTTAVQWCIINDRQECVRVRCSPERRQWTVSGRTTAATVAIIQFATIWWLGLSARQAGETLPPPPPPLSTSSFNLKQHRHWAIPNQCDGKLHTEANWAQEVSKQMATRFDSFFAVAVVALDALFNWNSEFFMKLHKNKINIFCLCCLWAIKTTTCLLAGAIDKSSQKLNSNKRKFNIKTIT